MCKWSKRRNSECGEDKENTNSEGARRKID